MTMTVGAKALEQSLSGPIKKMTALTTLLLHNKYYI